MSYNAPDNITGFFQIFFRLIRSPRFSIVGIFFLDIFGQITPSLSRQTIQSLPSLRISTVDLYIFFACEFYCFFLTALFCMVSGTLYSDNPNTVAFSADKWNIWLYLLICPLYVVFCVRLIFLVVEGPEPEITAITVPNTASSRFRLFTSIFLTLLFSLLLITSYVSDATDIQKITKSYWFLTELNGVRILNIAGIYYIALNFSLLVITFLGAASFISVSIDGTKLARELLNASDIVEFDNFKNRLTRLTKAYYYGTFLVFAYVLNVLIWKESYLGKTAANINVAGAILTLFALFFVSVPRRYVQHLWAEYELQLTQISDGCYRDILPNQSNRTIDLLSTIFIGSWFNMFWEIDLDPLKILIDMFKP